METRAHHLMIGIFAIAVTAAIFAFTLWVSKSDLDVNWKEYDIVFAGSVAGLKRNADVLYNGLKVGEVHDLYIEPKDPSKVRVKVRVGEATPVTTESKAKLSSQLLTGLAIVALSGGSDKATKLEPTKGDKISFIKAEATPGLDQLTASADVLIAKGAALADTLNGLLAENRDEITAIIANARDVSDQLKTIGSQVQEVAESAKRLATTAETFISADGRKALADAAGAASEAKAAMTELRQLFAENRPPIREFTKNVFPEAFLLISDSRQLISTIDRFATRLERSPSSIFFGEKAPEYGAQQ